MYAWIIRLFQVTLFVVVCGLAVVVLRRNKWKIQVPKKFHAVCSEYLTLHHQELFWNACFQFKKFLLYRVFNYRLHFLYAMEIFLIYFSALNQHKKRFKVIFFSKISKFMIRKKIVQMKILIISFYLFCKGKAWISKYIILAF